MWRRSCTHVPRIWCTRDFFRGRCAFVRGRKHGAPSPHFCLRIFCVLQGSWGCVRGNSGSAQSVGPVGALLCVLLLGISGQGHFTSKVP